MPGPSPGPIVGIRPRIPLASTPGRYFEVSAHSASAAIVLYATCNAGQPAGSPVPLPITGTRRRKPFVGPTPYRRVFVVSQVAGAAEIILAAAASEIFSAPVSASAEIILSASCTESNVAFVSAAASIILTATASESNAASVSASAEIILSAACTEANVAIVDAAAEIILSASASETSLVNVDASAEIILSATASESPLEPVLASAEIILSASAAENVLWSPVVGSAEIILSASAVERTPFKPLATATLILSASASETATFDSFLLHTPLAVMILSAGAGLVSSFSGAAGAEIILEAHGNATGGRRTAVADSWGLLLLRCRADVPGMAVARLEDYLGRFQQGDEVPLQIQCFAGAATPGLPDAAPVVRMYRDGTLVDEVILALQPNTQVVGRFGANYRLGYLSEPGRYLAAYWYQASDMVQSQYQVFEVVGGGDPAGPVLAAQSIRRPDGDRMLAQVASGALLLGQDPYLDEGV